MPQKRPDGPLVDVTPEWVSDVRARMTARRINKSELGRMLDPPVSRQAITDMLADFTDGEIRQSRLVPAVNVALGIGTPSTRAQALTLVGHSDMLTARLVAAAEALDVETRAELASIAERLARLHAKKR